MFGQTAQFSVVDKNDMDFLFSHYSVNASTNTKTITAHIFGGAIEALNKGKLYIIYSSKFSQR